MRNERTTRIIVVLAMLVSLLGMLSLACAGEGKLQFAPNEANKLTSDGTTSVWVTLTTLQGLSAKDVTKLVFVPGFDPLRGRKPEIKGEDLVIEDANSLKFKLPRLDQVDPDEVRGIDITGPYRCEVYVYVKSGATEVKKGSVIFSYLPTEGTGNIRSFLYVAGTARGTLGKTMYTTSRPGCIVTVTFAYKKKAPFYFYNSWYLAPSPSTITGSYTPLYFGEFPGIDESVFTTMEFTYLVQNGRIIPMSDEPASTARGTDETGMAILKFRVPDSEQPIYYLQVLALDPRTVKPLATNVFAIEIQGKAPRLTLDPLEVKKLDIDTAESPPAVKIRIEGDFSANNVKFVRFSVGEISVSFSPLGVAPDGKSFTVTIPKLSQISSAYEDGVDIKQEVECRVEVFDKAEKNVGVCLPGFTYLPKKKK